MSISSDPELCTGCRECQKICPGGLFQANKIGMADDCWGCTACVKACPSGALSLVLSPVLGGLGARLKVTGTTWTVTFPDGTSKTLDAPLTEANHY